MAHRNNSIKLNRNQRRFGILGANFYKPGITLPINIGRINRYRNTFDTQRLGGVLSAGAFAQKMMARYLSRFHPWPQLRFMLHLDPPASVFASSPTQTQVNLYPNIHLTLLQSQLVSPTGEMEATQLSSSMGWQAVRRPVSQERVARVMHHLARYEEHRDKKTTHQVQRILQRAQPIEAVATSSNPTTVRRISNNPTAVQRNPNEPALAQSMQPAARPVPRVVHKAGRSFTSAEQASASDTQMQPARAAETMPRNMAQSSFQGSPPNGTSPVDVNRLTDQVVQALDRRLLAFRERTGRI